MLKILQARLQQYMNHKLPDIQAGWEKAEEPEIKLPISSGSWKKQESSRKTSISPLLTMPKPLMKVKEGSKKVVLKLNIQKMKIMASGPIMAWEIDGETVSDFILGAPKSLQMVISAMKLKDTYSLEGKLWPT